MQIQFRRDRLKKINVKKIVTILFCISLTAVFTACGKDDSGSENAAEKSAYIHAGEGRFQLLNQKGDSLAYEGGDQLDGKMPVSFQRADEGGYTLEVPYSDSFTYTYTDDASGAQQSFQLWDSFDVYGQTAYSVSGTGIKSVTIDFSGRISFTGQDMQFTVSLNPAGHFGMGQVGSVEISAVAEEAAAFTVSGTQVMYEGVNPGDAVLSCKGEGVANPGERISLNAGTGMIDFCDAAEGTVQIVEDGIAASIYGFLPQAE